MYVREYLLSNFLTRSKLLTNLDMIDKKQYNFVGLTLLALNKLILATI